MHHPVFFGPPCICQYIC